jgi:magnesium-transporting ATPase (P-type)
MGIAVFQIAMYNDYRSVIPLSIFTLLTIGQHLMENYDRIKEQLRINSLQYQINKNLIKNIVDINIGDEIELDRHKDIPADIKLDSGKLVVNEYNLTGEKIDINKFEGDIIYRGTVIVDGHALGKVIEIGNKCKIYNLDYNIKKNRSCLENTLYQICINNIYLLLSISLGFSGYIYYYYSYNKILHLILLFNTLIPLSLQFFLNCSSKIISTRIEKKFNVKINSNGIKSFLFNPKYIVTDKTGTLTINKIELDKIITHNNLDINNVSTNIIASSMIDLHSETKEILKHDILEELLLKYLFDKNIKLEENNVKKFGGNFVLNNKLYLRHFYENYIYAYGVKISIIEYDKKYYMHIQGMPESINKYLSDSKFDEFHKTITDTENIISDNYYLRIIAHASKEISKSELQNFLNKKDNEKNIHLKDFNSWSIYVFKDYIVDGLRNTIKNMNEDITMLTGDKYSTSLNVGKLTGLIDSEYLHIDDNMSSITKLTDKLSKNKILPILISGSTLENIIINNKKMFENLILFTNKRIIYRATPNLKQLYVSTLQSMFKEDVMMIGEVTNDLSAIMSSNVGVGIIGENDMIQKVSDIVIENWNVIPLLLDEFKFMKIISYNISKWVLFKHILTAFTLCGILISSNFQQIRDPANPILMATFNSIIFIIGMLYTYYYTPKNIKKFGIKNEYRWGICLGIMNGIITYNLFDLYIGIYIAMLSILFILIIQILYTTSKY